MTQIVVLLFAASAVGFAVGRFVHHPSRRLFAGLWIGAPSLLFGKALIQGGLNTLLLSTPWLLLVLIIWGTPALLGFAIGSVRRQALLED